MVAGAAQILCENEAVDEIAPGPHDLAAGAPGPGSDGLGERLSQPRLERVLAASWQSYREQFISPEGRVVLPERDGGTISEAQAYALLRAVWAGDEATFPGPCLDRK